MSELNRTKKTEPEKTVARKSPRTDHADGESAVLAKIAEMPEPYRGIGERLHAMIRSTAPALSPKVWYGMPAYARDGKVVCFFRGVIFGKKERYMTIGFSEEAKLDDGPMWPTSYAITELTDAGAAMLSALVKKAAG